MNVFALAAVVSLALVLGALGLIRYIRLRAAQDEEEDDSPQAFLRTRPAEARPGVPVSGPPQAAPVPGAGPALPEAAQPQAAAPADQAGTEGAPAAPAKAGGEGADHGGLDAMMLDTFRPVAEEGADLSAIAGRLEQVGAGDLADLAATVSGELKR